MMCGEGNEQQEQMTSEAAKSLVSIANALIRMEKGREKKKKGREYKAEKMPGKDVFSCFHSSCS